MLSIINIYGLCYDECSGNAGRLVQQPAHVWASPVWSVLGCLWTVTSSLLSRPPPLRPRHPPHQHMGHGTWDMLQVIYNFLDVPSLSVFYRHLQSFNSVKPRASHNQVAVLMCMVVDNSP